MMSFLYTTVIATYVQTVEDYQPHIYSHAQAYDAASTAEVSIATCVILS